MVTESFALAHDSSNDDETLENVQGNHLHLWFWCDLRDNWHTQDNKAIYRSLQGIVF